VAYDARKLDRCVKGVMLGVGSDNEKGVNFYKKYGFHVIKKGPGFYKLGIFTDKTDSEKGIGKGDLA
jgi:ribosomal protein S18 acetylase RimI-like enzyme